MKAKWYFVARILTIVLILAVMAPASAAASRLAGPLNDGEVSDTPTAETSAAAQEIPPPLEGAAAESESTPESSPTLADGSEAAPTETPTETPTDTAPPGPTETLTQSETLEAAAAPEPSPTAEEKMQFSSAQLSKMLGGGGPDVMFQKVKGGGRLPVIVGLDVSFTPMGELSAPAASVQKENIARMQKQVIGDLAAKDVRNVKEFKYIPYMAMNVDEAGLKALIASGRVTSITIDELHKPTLDVSVPLIGGTTAWGRGYSGSGRTVAILDTGVDKNHGFFGGRVVSEACYSTTYSGYNSTSLCPGGVPSSTAVNSAIPYYSGGVCPSGECDHGTHVAGIAAGYSSTSFAGVAKDANIIAIQVFSRFDSTYYCGGSSPCALAWTSDEMLGLQRVYELRSTYNIDAANLSLGGGQYSSYCDSTYPEYKAAIDNLRSANIATVISSGNEGYTGALAFPACISSAVSVGSTNDYNQVVPGSNSASFLNLLAPGATILSSVPGGGYESWGGTSMAAPHVTGAWAILKQSKPSATVADILAALTSSGVPIYDTKNGITKPRINVNSALDSFVPPKATTISPTGTITDNNTPTFLWDAISNVTQYEFQVNNTTAIVSRTTYTPTQVSCASGTGTCSLPYTSALPNTDYKWWVRASNAAGWGAWSDVRNFTIALPPAAKVTTISPSGTLTISTPTYEWNAVSDAIQYEVQVNNATAMVFRTTYTPTQASCPSGSGACSLLQGTALSDGAYRWWVRARNAIGWGAWSDERTFTIDLPKPPAKPTTVSPAGTLTTSNTPTYVWNALSGVVEYDFWLSDPAGMIFRNTYAPADVSCASGSGTCSLPQGTPLANNTYRWWVRASNAVGWGAWSDVRTFTIAVPLPAKATTVSPTGTITTTTTPTYVWNAIGSVIEYDFWLSDPSGMIFRNTYAPADVSCASGTGTCSLLQGTALPYTNYRWWVRARNIAGWGAWSNERAFTIAMPPAAKVTSTSPTGTITIAAPTYEWNAVSDAIQYEVQLNSASAVVFKTTYTPTQASCPSGSGACSLLQGTALSDGAYRWWVRAQNGGGWGAWSDERTFTIDLPKPPAKPTTVSPTGTLTTSNTPTYVWNALSGVTSYDFWLSDPAGMIFRNTYAPADVSCASGTGTCSLPQATPLANNTYRWWVRASNANGWGAWSDVRTFTVSVSLPPKATTVSPTGTITNNTPTYVWNAIGSAIEYDFWLSDPSGMIFRNTYAPADVSCASGSGTCSLLQGTALPYTNYRWWVRARNIAGWGAWSDERAFTIAMPPASKVTSTSPTGTITNGTPTYQWNAVSDAIQYEFQLNNAAGFLYRTAYTPTQVSCPSGSGTCSLLQATALTDNVYRWWVRARNNVGWGAWSDVMTFTVDIP